MQDAKELSKETEKIHEDTINLMIKAQTMMTKNMDYYEQIRAHIEYEGEHIACNKENLQTHLKTISNLINQYETQKNLIESLFKVYIERLNHETKIKSELKKLKRTYDTIQ